MTGELIIHSPVAQPTLDTVNGNSVKELDNQSNVVAILRSALGVPDGTIAADPDTPLLGAIPEMDSMSVVAILLSIEEQYGITVDDEEIDADVFATVGSLTVFVESKLG